MDLIEIEPQAETPDGFLRLGTFDAGAYGYKFDGAFDDDGRVNFLFDASPDGAGLDLDLRGYDIDDEVEVSVLVNGTLIGFLSTSTNQGESASQFYISSGLLEDDGNFLTFVHSETSDLRWGVTDILLTESGSMAPNELPFDFDPEFSEDGYVTWQSFEGFYLGRMDLDTGDFVEIVNFLPVRPILIFDTVQGVELIRTPDGVAALGMSEQGIVYISETEAKVLEGTEGLRFSTMPKGETPGLRFICYDSQGHQFLYDDGTLTDLKLGFSQAFQWLNESEVLLRNELNGRTEFLNVETGERTFVTDERYNGGQAAAFTDSDGTEYLTMQGDGYRDIYIDNGTGWAFQQRMTSPLSVGTEHFSPEFFEWHDRVFMLGTLSSDLGQNSDAAIVLYDLGRDAWAQLSGIDAWKDPEVMILNDGSIAFYADDTEALTQHYGTITYTAFLLRSALSGGAVPAAEVVDGIAATDLAALTTPALAAFVAPPAAVAAVDVPAVNLAAPAALAPWLAGFDEADGFDFAPAAPVKPTSDTPATEAAFGPLGGL